MPKKPAKKQTSKKRAVTPKKPLTIRQKAAVKWAKVKQRYRAFMKRRPHRSFRRTRRRDYVRSLSLPGYIGFSRTVIKTLHANRKALRWLGVLMIVFMIATNSFSAISSNYTTVTQLMSGISDEDIDNSFGVVGKAALVSFSVFSSGLSSSGDQALQILTGLALMIVWLTVVWLLRATMAGNKVQLRDALYSSGSPIVATFLLLLYLFLQAVPVMITAIVYSALTSVGYITSGFGAMLFWTFAMLVLVLSMYWATATFFALIIVTLPGMRPMQALQVAGDMVVGRRLRLMLRIVWMIITALVMWFVIVIPAVMLDSWMKSTWPQIGWLPFVPSVIAIVNTLIAMWFASYVYILYRKVVDDDAKPA